MGVKTEIIPGEPLTLALIDEIVERMREAQRRTTLTCAACGKDSSEADWIRVRACPKCRDSEVGFLI